MASDIECPYCLARIPERASICQHCGQQLTLLLDARRKLAEAEGKLAAALAQVGGEGGSRDAAPPSPPWNPNLALAAFYVVALSVLSTEWVPDRYVINLLVIMSLVLGVVIAHRDETPNLWQIAFYAFALPAIGSVIVFARNTGDVLKAWGPDAIRTGFALALILGIAAAAGGFVDLLVERRARLGSALQFPMVATLSASADNWSRFAAAILSLLTAVSGIAAWLLSGIKS